MVIDDKMQLNWKYLSTTTSIKPYPTNYGRLITSNDGIISCHISYSYLPCKPHDQLILLQKSTHKTEQLFVLVSCFTHVASRKSI
jgi:hypothetical protein